MSLWALLVDVAETDPDKVAVKAPDATLTYRELLLAAEAAEGKLRDQGLKLGDRVGYLGFNSAALIVLIAAAARARFILCPLNWRLATEELAWIMGQAEPVALVADMAHADVSSEIADGCTILDAAQFGASDSSRPTSRPLQGSRATGAGEDPLLLVYTSGATGRPKGAVLTQAAVLANAALSWDMHGMHADDHVLTALPMFHVGGLNIQTLPALLTGATVTLLDRFEPSSCLSALIDCDATLTVQVPATLQALMAHPDWLSSDLHALRAIATGSTDVPKALIRQAHAKGIPVIQIYGATETGPVVIYQRVEEAKSHLGSIGRAGPGVDARITGSDGAALPDGEAGEIWLKSPTLTEGYWRDAAADAAFIDGWFRTGDVAKRDADGYFWFTDRLKNVIISGGENIYPAELERILRDVPGVTEAAVAGRPDPKWGEVPVAAVVGSATRDQILDAFDGRLARFKHPKDVIYLDALPRNAMGKVETGRVCRLIAGD